MSIYDKLVMLNDKWTEAGMELQELERENRFYGGVADPYNGIPWPSHGGTPMVMGVWAASLLNKDSRYYRNEELLRRLELAARFVLRFQHEDGTISPPWTNMHSPPDTAFVINGLAQVCELLEADDWDAVGGLASDVRLFLERTIPAMLTGGVHTPNHRWVMTGALAFLYKLTGRAELKERADAWLAEGMDCTEDGEWTERSNGIYNTVSDIVLFYAAELLDRPELLEPVRRNLRMMAYMIHPDGEVVTDYSGRQDFGTKFDLGGYFLVASLMADRDRDPLFAAMASLAANALNHPGYLPNQAMLGLLRYPELRHPAVEPGQLPDEYRLVVNGSFPRETYLKGMEEAGHGGRIYHSKLHPEFGAPVARHRKGGTSATVMTETSSFFALRHGSVRLLAVQLGTAFEPGFVKAGRLEELDGGTGYRLTAVERKGYYGPLKAEQLPASASGAVSPWYSLPHQLREVTHEQRHDVAIELKETEQGWQIRIVCDKPDPLLTQVSFVFGREGAATGSGLASADTGTRFWTGGTVRYAAGNDWLELDGGAFEHKAAKLNGIGYPADCETLLVNLITPYDRTFEIRLSPSH